MGTDVAANYQQVGLWNKICSPKNSASEGRRSGGFRPAQALNRVYSISKRQIAAADSLASDSIEATRLARIVKRCRDLPGYELFQYVDDAGEARPIDSADVNEYLREIAGSEFSAKDFRTWGGTVLATVELSRAEPSSSAALNRTIILRAVEVVAEELGNTPAVCRNCYIHPA